MRLIPLEEIHKLLTQLELEPLPLYKKDIKAGWVRLKDKNTTYYFPVGCDVETLVREHGLLDNETT